MYCVTQQHDAWHILSMTRHKQSKKCCASYLYDCPDANGSPSRLRASESCRVHPSGSNLITPNSQTAHCRASRFPRRRMASSVLLHSRRDVPWRRRVLAHEGLGSHLSGPQIMLRTTRHWMTARLGLGLAGAYDCLFVGE